MQRLDKRLADTGRWSRKQARQLIRAGRVEVAGQVCRAPEQKVDGQAAVRVDGVDIGGAGPVYLMLYKPAGLLSATRDAGQETVFRLLPPPLPAHGAVPRGTAGQGYGGAAPADQ